MDQTHFEHRPEDFARQISERRAELRESDRVIRFAHSRSGLLARFLQRMADTIDPTGEARRAI
jgi:hypothetical protein